MSMEAAFTEAFSPLIEPLLEMILDLREHVDQQTEQIKRLQERIDNACLNKPYLSKKEAAKMLGKSEKTVERLEKVGELTRIPTDDNTVRFRTSQVMRLVEEGVA